MTATVLGRHQVASLLFLLLVAPGTQLGARATTDCTSGFISLDRLVGLATKPELISLADQGRLSVSPQINFTCDGNITKWIMGGSWDSSINILSGPELQVWRANKSSPNNYHRVGRTFIAVAVENSSSRVYEYPVDPPLPVEAGDVLGIYQPAQSVSRLKVLYERDSGPVTLYQAPHNSENFPEAHGTPTQSHSSLPLVTVELVPKPTAAVSSFMMSTSLSASPGGGVDMPASFPATAVGVGVAVGVVVVMATLACSAVVIVVCTHKKRNHSSNDSTNTRTDAEEVKSSEACVKSPSIVENEAYGIAESAQPIKIHGNDAYQTAAEAIATEQNEAYSGRVEGIDHTHSTTVEYEEISAPHNEYVEIIQ